MACCAGGGERAWQGGHGHRALADQGGFGVRTRGGAGARRSRAGDRGSQRGCQQIRPRRAPDVAGQDAAPVASRSDADQRAGRAGLLISAVVDLQLLAAGVLRAGTPGGPEPVHRLRARLHWPEHRLVQLGPQRGAAEQSWRRIRRRLPARLLRAGRGGHAKRLRLHRRGHCLAWRGG